MKWTIVGLAALLTQDKAPLAWRFKAKDTFVVKSTFTQAAGGSTWEYSFETEIEVQEAGTVVVRVLRSTGKGPDGGYAFERGKTAEGKVPEALSKDHAARLSAGGRLTTDAGDRETQRWVHATMGYLYGTVPVKNAAAGETWKTEEKFILPGPDAGLFLTSTLEKFDETSARIGVVGTGEGLDGETLLGKGEMTFSIAERRMVSYAFKVEERSGDKLLNSAEQRIEVELKR